MIDPGIIALLMFVVVCGALMLGFPVAFTLSGTALLFAGGGWLLGEFDPRLLQSLAPRIHGTMVNQVVVAVPLFVFMGVMLERSRIAEELLQTLGLLFGRLRGGLGLSVVIVGTLLAASTGIVGATVVTLSLLSLPIMLRSGYDSRLAAGVICSAGTLGQIIPPSIMLVLLGDILQGVYSQAQIAKGNFAPDPVSVVDLFAGALIPGLILVGLYVLWIVGQAVLRPASCPALVARGETLTGLRSHVLRALLPPLALVVVVLGSILAGIATPTESAASGSVGAVLLAATRRQLTLKILRSVMWSTTQISSMVFMILIGASIFSLVFRGLKGDVLVEQFLLDLPGGAFSGMLLIMAVMFLLGFVLDFLEIMFIVVPTVGPVLLQHDISPIWFGVMIAVNLQTSFLTPPFGLALFYLRGVAPPSLSTADIYRGVAPFVLLQLAGLGIIWAFPELTTWLPGVLFR
jgi:tripartite ATP-independent transporter DctM subunit